MVIELSKTSVLAVVMKELVVGVEPIPEAIKEALERARRVPVGDGQILQPP